MPKRKQVSVNVYGVIKKVSLPYVEENTPFGTYNLLDARGSDIPKMELIRLANSLKHPILSDYGKIFPEGKMARDFVKKKKAKKS